MLDREARARVLRALGDPTRLAIVEHLQEQDLSPDALAANLDVPSNLMAHHLKVLQSAGLVVRAHSQHDRRRTYVHLDEEILLDALPRPAALNAPRVVFVCTQNSARSILADALWRKASSVPSTSAGTHPAERINPKARAAARRAGLTLGQELPQQIAEVLRDGDLVISVCDSVNEELPDLAHRRIHWSVPDPVAVGTDAAFNGTLRDLQTRVLDLAPRVRTEGPH